METIKHVKALILIFVLLVIGYLLETLKWGHPGVIVGAAEVISESAAALCLLHRAIIVDRSLNRSRIALAAFFGLLAFADFFYVLFFYVMHMDYKTPVALFFSTFVYCLAFLAAVYALASGMNRSWFKQFTLPAVLIPALITIPIAFRFLIVPFFSNLSPSGITLYDVSQLADIVSSLVLINIAILAFLSSRTLFWSFFSCGVITVVLADWAMRVETLLGHAPEFGFYEYFWNFGIFLCAVPIILFRNAISQMQPFRLSGLVAGFRFWSLVLLFVSVIFLLAAQPGDIGTIRVITVGLSLGTVVLAIVSNLYADRIRHFYKVLGDILGNAFDPARVEDPALEAQLPVELQETYRLVFQSRIEDRSARDAKELEISIHRAQSKIARQVAHNIRSPLAALESSYDELAPLPEDVRILFRSSIARIRDVANNLISKFDPTAKANTVEVTALTSLTDSIVSENRTQYRSRSNVTITFRPEIGGYGLFARVQPGELKTVLSNVINNAVEAVPTDAAIAGSVSIELRKEANSSATIFIKDNGSGFNPEIIPKLFQSGATFDKPKGTGEGLAHAKEMIESWGGEIGIKTSIGLGTEVRITLPLVSPPSWFIDGISLSAGDTVIVLDDDVSIHQIWKNRLSNPEIQAKAIHLLHCTTPTEVHSALNSSLALDSCPGNGSGQLICLFDHELLGHETTGLNLLQAIDPEAIRILVTSHADEGEIQDICMKSGIRLLPKDMAAFIPIRLQDAATPLNDVNVVVLDDDWALMNRYIRAFETRNMTAIGFKNPDDLLRELPRIPANTVFVIDQNLGNGITGSEVAKKIAESGRRLIILNTGSDEHEELRKPWIKTVVTKGQISELHSAVVALKEINKTIDNK